jgi:hypothetical protein
MADSTYACETCKADCTAEVGSTLSLLRLCRKCAEKRFRKGQAEKRKAEMAERCLTGAANDLSEHETTPPPAVKQTGDGH